MSVAATSSVAAENVLALRGVSKRFANGTLALRDIDFDLGEGEFLALLGPSGCGKSTLLRIIAGLLAPSTGSVKWSSGPRRPNLGFVFQDATLMPWTSALRNVMLPLTLARANAGEAEQRAAEMLRLVGLEGFEKSYPRELSGGMRMRVSIARALVTRPRVLLMDEPFAALDEITRHRLNDDLLELWQRERFSTIFVTHSVFESGYLAQRIAVMTARPGRLVEEFANPAPYPRDPQFRTSGAYAELCRAASDALQRASAA